ncbi:MAG: cytochrome c-type biogenesis protein CcmH [Gammaproteobacteria bacterium]|jgi:cytochrome c-type biogenesis protein CcmH
MMKKFILPILFLLGYFGSTNAAIEAYQFKTAEMEADYTQLINELRCLVCQNQNLSGSNSDLAKDLRRQTFEMLTAGNSSEQVVDFMVQRYGDFVLYRPPLQQNTWLLWLGPFVLLSIVLMLMINRFRKKQPLDTTDENALAKARALLQDQGD